MNKKVLVQLRKFEKKERIESAVKWSGMFIAALTIIIISIISMVYLHSLGTFMVEWVAIAGLGVWLAVLSIVSMIRDRRELDELVAEIEAEYAEEEAREAFEALRNMRDAI